MYTQKLYDVWVAEAGEEATFVVELVHKVLWILIDDKFLPNTYQPVYFYLVYTSVKPFTQLPASLFHTRNDKGAKLGGGTFHWSA